MICDKTHNPGERCVDRFKAYNYIKDNSEPVDNGLALTAQGDYGKYIMSLELIALIGIGVTVISIGVALAALILITQRNLRADIRADMRAQREETRAEFKAVRTEMQVQREETQAGFKALREEIISLRERVAHLEGLLEGLREAITGRRVAEEAGKYDPR